MDRPNIVIIMTDQQQAGLCAREGYPLDTTPFLDSLARQGAWFNRAYTVNPTCAPARVSLFTGRFPSATRVRCNHNLADAFYETDLTAVLKDQGYTTALSGKNHSHLREGRDLDYASHYGHGGGSGEGRTDAEMAFDTWLTGLRHQTALDPTPFPVELQGPCRAVRDAESLIDSIDREQPFFLWLSFAEPHNPFQIPEPYYSMFPPDSIPAPRNTAADIARKNYPWRKNHQLWLDYLPDYDAQTARAPSNYHGMLRLIDDQIKRFVGFLDDRGLRENTLLVFLSDHGDFCGQYNVMRKGPEMPEELIRIPLLFNGPGIVASETPRDDFVSLVDVMPTLCDMLGVALPPGVQGRSLWPMLTGGDYPEAEFESVYAEHGYGGLFVNDDDGIDPNDEGAYGRGCTYDCLNTWTQCGTLRMLRRGQWKLLYDMMGNGQLYDLANDPGEKENLFGSAKHAEIEHKLLAELLAWTLRAQDPLPHPRHRYRFKTHPRNYYAASNPTV